MGPNVDRRINPIAITDDAGVVIRVSTAVSFFRIGIVTGERHGIALRIITRLQT
jgi:hypothetical protein